MLLFNKNYFNNSNIQVCAILSDISIYKYICTHRHVHVSVYVQCLCKYIYIYIYISEKKFFKATGIAEKKDLNVNFSHILKKM